MVDFFIVNFFRRKKEHSLFIILLLTSVSVIAGVGDLRDASAASKSLTAACQDIVINGGFEASTAGNWRFGATAAIGTVVTTPIHSGGNAVRLGIPATETNRKSESTVYQSITIPAGTQSATLTYWERPGISGDSGTGGDYRELILLRANFTVFRVIERTTGSGNDSWRQRSFDLTNDLSALAGETVVLYFNVSNNGSGQTLVSYLDDIALQLCDGSATPTVAPTATTTPVSSPATSMPLTPAPTVASTPAPVRIRAGTAQPPSGVTAVTVPLDLIVLTDRVNVAVLSLDLQYNASLLRPTKCTTSEAMAPLLCNIKTPGRIQLAGVAAQGIRSEVNLAQLTFELLQNTNRAEPLTLQLGLVGDVNGAAVSTDSQNGAITLSCAPTSEECTSLNIYLPVVHR